MNSFTSFFCKSKEAQSNFWVMWLKKKLVLKYDNVYTDLVWEVFKIFSTKIENDFSNVKKYSIKSFLMGKCKTFDISFKVKRKMK